MYFQSYCCYMCRSSRIPLDFLAAQNQHIGPWLWGLIVGIWAEWDNRPQGNSKDNYVVLDNPIKIVVDLHYLSLGLGVRTGVSGWQSLRLHSMYSAPLLRPSVVGVNNKFSRVLPWGLPPLTGRGFMYSSPILTIMLRLVRKARTAFDHPPNAFLERQCIWHGRVYWILFSK